MDKVIEAKFATLEANVKAVLSERDGLRARLEEVKAASQVAQDALTKLVDSALQRAETAEKAVANVEKDAMSAVMSRDRAHEKIEELLVKLNRERQNVAEVEIRAKAAEKIVEAWRQSKGFGDLREHSVGWESVRRLDAALEIYDKTPKE